jgi:hypothetical protein
MVKCKYCNNQSTRLPYSEKEKGLVNVCDWHYNQIKPSEIIQEKIKNYKQCSLCKTWAKRSVLHHTSYFPEKLIRVCISCHNKIHRGKLSNYDPGKKDRVLFYGGMIK